MPETIIEESSSIATIPPEREVVLYEPPVQLPPPPLPETVEAKRGRGRPKGSKNKPKVIGQVEAILKKKKEVTKVKRPVGRPKGSGKKRNKGKEKTEEKVELLEPHPYDLTKDLRSYKGRKKLYREAIKTIGETVSNITALGTVPEYIPPSFKIRPSGYSPLDYKVRQTSEMSGYTPSTYKPLEYRPIPQHKSGITFSGENRFLSSPKRRKSRSPRMVMGA